MKPHAELECFTFIINGGDNKVSWDFQDSWFCTCEDFTYRKHVCKHIRAVKKSLFSEISKALYDDGTCYDELNPESIQSKLVV